MTNKQFVLYNSRTDFDTALSSGEINQYQIVFIVDTKQIWTQNTFYSCPLTKEEIGQYVQELTNGKVDKVEGKDLISVELIQKLEELNIEEIQSALDNKANISDLSNVLAEDVDKVEIEDITRPPIDLSKRDIYGNTIEQSTANCYVVKEPGTYKFPIAYGTAIKNGAVNSVAYTNNGASGSTDFVNALGNAITSPYIEEDTGLALDSAYLSISDTDGIFSNISIIQENPCKYIKFTINEVPDTGANGVISVQGENGEILWNWHIWVWKDDLTPIVHTNSTGVTYKVLPTNLASKWLTDSVGENREFRCWFYQFGTPFPLICFAYEPYNNVPPTYGSLTYKEDSNIKTMQDKIKNPTTCGAPLSLVNNYWDQALTNYGASDNIVIKTVYDPCPIGFTIPNGNALDGIVDNENASTLLRHTGRRGVQPTERGNSLLWTSARKDYVYWYIYKNGSMTQEYQPAAAYSILPVADMSYSE